MANATTAPAFPLPSVHLNGTSREALQTGYEDAHRATSAAIQAFADNGFNARDYYTQGPNAYSDARAERDKHLKALYDARAYLEQHLEALY
jgi:hypothetical protein